MKTAQQSWDDYEYSETTAGKLYESVYKDGFNAGRDNESLLALLANYGDYFFKANGLPENENKGNIEIAKEWLSKINDTDIAYIREPENGGWINVETPPSKKDADSNGKVLAIWRNNASVCVEDYKIVSSGILFSYWQPLPPIK
jgi:hypothetical protein